MRVTFVCFFLSDGWWVTLLSSWGFITVVILLLEPFTKCFILLFSKKNTNTKYKNQTFTAAKSSPLTASHCTAPQRNSRGSKYLERASQQWVSSSWIYGQRKELMGVPPTAYGSTAAPSPRKEQT